MSNNLTYQATLLACAKEGEQFLKESVDKWGAEVVTMVYGVYGVNMLGAAFPREKAEKAIKEIMDEYYSDDDEVMVN